MNKENIINSFEIYRIEHYLHILEWLFDMFMLSDSCVFVNLNLFINRYVDQCLIKRFDRYFDTFRYELNIKLDA